MKTKFYLGAALCAGLIAPTIASAQSATETTDVADILPVATDVIEEYRTAGTWQIFANTTRAHCFMTKSDESGAVQMGLTKTGEYGYVGAFIKGAEIEEGPKAIAISVNGNMYFGESNTAVNLSEGYNGGYILSNNKELRLDLEKGDEMIAFPDGPNQITIDLKDTRNAIYEVRKCTEELQ